MARATPGAAAWAALVGGWVAAEAIGQEVWCPQGEVVSPGRGGCSTAAAEGQQTVTATATSSAGVKPPPPVTPATGPLCHMATSPGCPQP